MCKIKGHLNTHSLSLQGWGFLVYNGNIHSLLYYKYMPFLKHFFFFCLVCSPEGIQRDTQFCKADNENSISHVNQEMTVTTSGCRIVNLMVICRHGAQASEKHRGLRNATPSEHGQIPHFSRCYILPVQVSFKYRGVEGALHEQCGCFSRPVLGAPLDRWGIRVMA